MFRRGQKQGSTEVISGGGTNTWQRVLPLAWEKYEAPMRIFEQLSDIIATLLSIGYKLWFLPLSPAKSYESST